MFKLNYIVFLFLGELGKAPNAVTDTLPTLEEPEGATAAVSDAEDEDLMAKLEALRS